MERSEQRTSRAQGHVGFSQVELESYESDLSGGVKTASIGGGKSIEEKAAAKLLDTLGHMTFDPNLFGYALVQNTPGVMRSKLRETAEAILRYLSATKS